MQRNINTQKMTVWALFWQNVFTENKRHNMFRKYKAKIKMFSIYSNISKKSLFVATYGALFKGANIEKLLGGSLGWGVNLCQKD